MLEYQNKKIIFQKVTFQNGLKKFLWLKKLKILHHGHVISDRNGEENVLWKTIAKTNQKVMRKCDELYVKWKGYENSFNSWIDKKDIV